MPIDLMESKMELNSQFHAMELFAALFIAVPESLDLEHKNALLKRTQYLVFVEFWDFVIGASRGGFGTLKGTSTLV